MQSIETDISSLSSIAKTSFRSRPNASAESRPFPFDIPPVFPGPNPAELKPGHRAHAEYLDRRVAGLRAILKGAQESGQLADHLYDHALEFVGLEYTLQTRGSLTDSEQFQYEVLSEIIFNSGYFVPLDEIRATFKQTVEQSLPAAR